MDTRVMMDTRVIVSVNVYVDLLLFCKRVKKLLQGKGKSIGGLAKYLAYYGGKKRLEKVLGSDEKIFDFHDKEMRERQIDVISLVAQADLIANFLGVDTFDLIKPAPKTRGSVPLPAPFDEAIHVIKPRDLQP